MSAAAVITSLLTAIALLVAAGAGVVGWSAARERGSTPVQAFGQGAVVFGLTLALCVVVLTLTGLLLMPRN
ncbi:hypothetical protein [Kitasatospora sp. NPDC093679]|uniref:hypothetical protein n=1 Tax=Kitasatospora sp. NPDC093679 TaxID=3154983 RepID=UPI0034409CB5